MTRWEWAARQAVNGPALGCLPPTAPLHPHPHAPQQFLLAELGTSGSLDGTQRLIVKGRFLPKVFETVLRR